MLGNPELLDMILARATLTTTLIALHVSPFWRQRVSSSPYLTRRIVDEHHTFNSWINPHPASPWHLSIPTTSHHRLLLLRIAPENVEMYIFVDVPAGQVTYLTPQEHLLQIIRHGSARELSFVRRVDGSLVCRTRSNSLATPPLHWLTYQVRDYVNTFYPRTHP